MNKPKIIDTVLYLFSLGFVVYLLSIHTITSTALYLGSKPTKWILFGSIAITLVYSVVSFIMISKKRIFGWLGVVPLFLICLSFLYGVTVNHQLYDISFDGQAYHGEAIVTIIEGWNPVKNPTSKGVNQYVDNLKFDSWLDSYPKTMWYNSAITYDLTKDFRDVKFFNFSIIFAGFAIAYLSLKDIQFTTKTEYNYLIASILSLLIVANPIAIVQSTTASLDGVLYFLIVILCGVLFQIYKEFENPSTQKYLNYFNLGATFIILSNIKLAGMIYGLLFISSFGLLVLLIKSRHLIELATVSIISLFLAVVVFGFNPYITNAIDYKNPLYPVFGPNAISFQENTPSNYRDKSNLEVFAGGLFFKSSDVFPDADSGEPAELKLPFTVYDSELKSFANPQIKKGGLGLFTGGITILVLICFICTLIYNYHDVLNHNHHDSGKQNSRVLKKIFIPIFIFGVFFISFILTKTSSTLRYIPHIWLLFVMILAFGLYTKNLQLKIFSVVIIAICFINTITMASTYFDNQIKISSTVTSTFNQMRFSGDNYQLYYGYSSSLRQYMYDNQISTVGSTQLQDDCWYTQNPFYQLSYSLVQVCVLKK